MYGCVCGCVCVYHTLDMMSTSIPYHTLDMMSTSISAHAAIAAGATQVSDHLHIRQHIDRPAAGFRSGPHNIYIYTHAHIYFHVTPSPQNCSAVYFSTLSSPVFFHKQTCTHTYTHTRAHTPHNTYTSEREDLGHTHTNITQTYIKT